MEGCFISYIFWQIEGEIDGMGNQTIANYTTVQKLQKGLYGKTRLSQSPDHCFLAIKIYQTLDQTHFSAVYAQTKITLDFQSKQIVRVRDVFQIDSARFAVAMDYQDRGSLAVNLKLKSMKELLLDMRELALSLKVLHLQKKIKHGNVKPSNIFHAEHTLLLSDISCPLFHLLRLRPAVGGYDYRSRESLEDKGSFASDIFSLGVIFIEMIAGKSIRELQRLEGVQKPSLIRQSYPSEPLLASIPDEDLQYLVRNMTAPAPLERKNIREVIDYLSTLINEKPKQRLIEPLVKDEGNPYRALQSVREFTFSFDKTHPCFAKFRINQNRISRMDLEPKRYQAVARESFPSGKWQVSFRVIDYGRNNEEIALGVLAEERRKEKMSGDIDQDHSVAYWSNCRTGKGSLCQNGVWSGGDLPGVRADGEVKMVVDTVSRDIEWWVDRQRVGVSSLAQGFWSQEYYLFVGLKGQGCELQIGRDKLSTS